MDNDLKLTPEFAEFLKAECGYTLLREINGHGICGLNVDIYTYSIHANIDGATFHGKWFYGDYLSAIAALLYWNGEGDPPYGWIKYKDCYGERSNPDRIAAE